MTTQDHSPKFKGVGIAAASRVSGPAVPEPASLLALGAGAGAVGLLKRWARKAA